MAKNPDIAQECKLIRNCSSPAWCGVMRTWCMASVKRPGGHSKGKRG